MKKIMFLIAFFAVSNFTYSQVDKVDVEIKKLMQKNRIVGLQLAVIKNNEIVKKGHYGLANIEDSIAVDDKTIFSINSITKAFTGVAIMQLVENGKLNLDEPISKYLDSLPKTWQNITLKQVVTHKSGIPAIWDSQGNMLSENREVLFKKMKEFPLVFLPDEDYEDAQGNYILLGMIIEKVSGQSYEKYIVENIFKKAQMNNSMKVGIGDFYKIFNHSAKPYSYFRDNNVLTNVYQPIPSSLNPAGGIYSSATEMAQWIIALQNNKLVNSENLKILLAPITLKNGEIYETNNFLNRSSIGFYSSSRIKNPVIASLGGNRNALYIYPKDNISVVILTNLVGSRPENFIEEIANLYLAEKK
ncbi:serine hydrolase domain-containing protein [Flavobacterium sp. PL12]|jgi:CubicO group peptidase (beta-lactamase class C family)|uniref:serine hydrolase domain-containing protein n=1 Tax=Flavobacterium sp. PL12 TaxID=3071718 RepID=UPI00319D99F9